MSDEDSEEDDFGGVKEVEGLVSDEEGVSVDLGDD